MIEIKDDSLIECPWCSCSEKAINWDENTFKECITREMRRAYKSIKNIKVWNKKSNNFYKCPSCNLWSRGDQLILLDSLGIKINGIGGSPVMKILKSEDEALE